MPRLTDQSYLLQRAQLRESWLDDSKSAFFLLTPAEQWDLHMYYIPTEQLSDRALIEHRQDISDYDPSSPQRAGRALAKLRIMEQRLQDYRAAPKPARRKKKNAPYEIRIFGEVHPEIDVEQFARILINYRRRDEESSDRDAA
jgi:hypothetical protein